MRILVVEDDEKLANLLVRTLREESYAVDVAYDGQEAEFLAYENPYDTIVLDWMLPIRWYRCLKETKRKRHQDSCSVFNR